MQKSESSNVSLARTLGLGSIILLGVGALLGGGIFTLLGPAAGLAGPGLFIAMLLGAGIAFLNLQMYLALGTTFPEAGGGYLWVKKGLGHFQGFISGWMSWFAHGAAAGLYALSFGYYVYEILKIFIGDVNLGINLLSVEKITGTLVVLIFGYINWKGAKSSRTTGNVVDGVLVGVLFIFIVLGGIKIFSEPTISFGQFTPLLPHGVLGILGAAALFYIAFEGSEIQVQTGEETREPQKTLKYGLIWSWAIVSSLYVLVSLVVIGATRDGGGAISAVLAGWGEGAIVKAAAGFMPFGAFIMLVGGLLANLGALNATIYSCSRVAFAMARDKNIWSHIATIHLKNLSPHIAVMISTVLIALMVIFLPLLDVAALASLLFILLFLQLNIAGINIHYKWPNIKWAYKVPLFPLTPIIAIIAYILLAFTMLSVNLNAWIVAIFWTLLGLVNYYAYTERRSRARFENDIVYEGSVRIGPKTGKRILLPLSPELSRDETRNLAEFSFALASQFDGEVVAIRVHEIPPALALDPSVVSTGELDKERELFRDLQQLADDFNRRTGPEVKDINFHGFILIGRDTVDVLLDTIQMEECDVLLLNWQGYTDTKGTRFGPVIDRILREAKCDMVVVKNLKPVKHLLLATELEGKSPYLQLIGDVVSSVKKYYGAKTSLFSVLPKETPAYLKPDFSLVIKALGLKKKDFDSVSNYNSGSVIKAILHEMKQQSADTLLIGASQPRFLEEIRFGSTSELIAKHSKTGVIMVRGHETPTEVIWKRLLNFISK